MNLDNVDLEAFVTEAQLIHQKVTALANNTISAQQMDRVQAARAADKKRRQEYKLRVERQAAEKKRLGRDGKGITKDFANFCRACHKEYVLETPTCLKCNRPTMTLEQRQNQLSHMVEDYKYTKKSRQEKRQKWEMFQKTQAALWKKSSINYNQKWEYFVEDSDQEPEKQPILPTNDPNFKALEMDMEQRKKRRAKDTQHAKNLKEKGNVCLKQGDFQKAVQFYTLALEHIKDIKSIYTNRALAYIKLKKYKRAIKDCTNVIEYMEVFEKIGEHKDLSYKAFSRRAWARKQLKQYKEALNDINEALKLLPGDKTALLTKKQIESFIQHTSTVEKIIRENQSSNINQKDDQEESEDKQNQSKKIQKQIIKQLAESQLKQEGQKKQAEIKQQKQQIKQSKSEENPIEEITKRLQSLTESNVQYLLNTLIKKKELKNIFISAKGIEKTLDHILKEQSNKKQALLICLCLEGDGVAEKRVQSWGINKMYERILAKFEDQTKLNQSVYDFIDNLFEILVPMSLYEPTRLQLSKSENSYKFIETLFPKLITKFKKQTALLQNYLIYFSNLCSGQSTIKNRYLSKQQFIVIVQSLYLMVFDYKSKNRKILDLKQSIYSFISNVITNVDHRRNFVNYIKKNNRLQDIKEDLELYPRQSHNFQRYIENILSVLANASLETQIQNIQIPEVIFDRFINIWDQFNKTIIYRGLLVVSRFKYKSNKNLIKWMKIFDKLAAKMDPLKDPEDKAMTLVVNILNRLFAFDQPDTVTQIPSNLFSSLVKYIGENQNNQILFCNSCNLFGILLQKKQILQKKVLAALHPKIMKLVSIAAEKTGNWRKSAAILLAKSSYDAKCKAQLDRNHGMEVLKSIANYVTDKK